MKKYLLILLAFVISAALQAQGTQQIKPNDERLTITGAYFLDKSDQKVVINRFDKKTLKNQETYMNTLNANTQTGVIVSFSTNSPEIKFHFAKRDDAKIRHCAMGIFKDGKLIREVKLKKDNPENPVVFTNPDGAKWAEWEIVLPPFYGMDFTGLEIAKDSELKKAAEKPRKVYVAIGNSITHGTGQLGSYQTYPFLLAREKGWELYNLGVGGSKISWPVGKMLKDKKIDYITILWGYNDWNAGFTADGKIKTNYEKLLEWLVKNHPDTKIYCILPTATKREQPKKGNETIGDIRIAEAKVVKSFQDQGNKNLFIIHGEEISDTADLKDVVHFSVEGAKKFAGKLTEIIK